MRFSDDWRARWSELWGIDLRTLALFRCALASVISVEVFRRLFLDLRAFHTDYGFMPRDWLIQSDSLWRINLYLANGEPWFAALLLLLTLLSALAMAFGYRTRTAVVALFLLEMSLQNRNPLVLIGGDNLLMCLLFWAMFLPLGARWSVDAALSVNPPPHRNLHVSWASAGLLVQVMSVYFFSAVLKNGADWWPDGLAVYYTMELERYATPLGRWMSQFPLPMQALSYYVYFLEWAGPVLVFLPLLLAWMRAIRFSVMLMLMGMHVGFILCMEIGHFPYVSLASLTTFLGGWFWDWLAKQRDHGRVTKIFYDRDCGFCHKMCLLLETFLVLPRAEIQPAQNDAEAGPILTANNSWVVKDAEGRLHLKWAAFVALVRDSLLFGWTYRVAALKIWRWPGTASYDFVARHRGRFADVSAILLPHTAVKFEVGRLGQGIAGLFLVLVFMWNLSTIKVLPEASVQGVMRIPFRLLRLDQTWNMFAPFPSRADGWVVYPGVLEDGSTVDVLRPERPLNWDKPPFISQTHENVRWHTMRWRIWEKEFAANRLHYGKYLCRDWNVRAKSGKHLLNFEMTHVQEMSPPPGGERKAERVVIWRHSCVATPAPKNDP